MTHGPVGKSAFPRRQAVGIILLLASFVLAGCPNPTGSGGNDTPEDTGDDAAVQFTVSYDGNGATSGTAPADQTKTEGTDLTLATNSGNLARDGFTFAGWNTATDGTGTDYAEGATYSGDADLPLYAKWTALPTYTVSYNANDATSGTAPGDQTKTQAIDLTLANNTGGLARDGFTFAGWNTATDGSGTDYAEGATYSADADLTLYAEWTPAYTVTYNANGADSGSVPADQTKTHGTDLTLADNTGSLDVAGYQTFAGWNTASDGTGTSYAEGATYTTDADLTLYAEWADYQIGDTGPAGGVIFYDDEADATDDIAGARYLEAAPSDIDVSGDYTHVWGGFGTAVSAARGTAIGTGEANTAAIVAAYGASDPYNNTADYAARLADQYAYGGYDDWFLPSQDELDLMYQNKGAIGVFASDDYWSSSEYLPGGAWIQAFGGFSEGNQFTAIKYDDNYGVRAVRAF